MEIHYGNGGWVRVVDEQLPGDVFLRLEPDQYGRWRTRDFYLHGEWRHVVAADLRELNLSDLEEIVLADVEATDMRAGIAGPDLPRLAKSFATTYGAAVYDGRHCDKCDAPLKGATPRTPERWSNDWIALSWHAQYPNSKIRQPEVHEDKGTDSFIPRRVPRLQRPMSGLTDEFLSHVRDAYRQALVEGKNPAPELARQVGDGATVRTIHKWVSIARQRGIMPPASRRGRAS